jgi:hypothetical protein
MERWLPFEHSAYGPSLNPLTLQTEARAPTNLCNPRFHSYLFPSSFNLVGINGKDGNGRSSDHFSRHTSENNMLQTLSPVGSHDHHIYIFRLNGIKNFLGRIAVGNLLLKSGTTLQFFFANFVKGLFSTFEGVFPILVQGDMGNINPAAPFGKILYHVKQADFASVFLGKRQYIG